LIDRLEAELQHCLRQTHTRTDRVAVWMGNWCTLTS